MKRLTTIAAFAAGIIALTACTAGGESADTSSANEDSAEATLETSVPPVPPPTDGGSLVGIDQMPATARFTVSGPPDADDWNGSWNITSNRYGCGVLTYPRMVSVQVGDEDNTRGDFSQLDVGSQTAGDVGTPTSTFSVRLSLDRTGPVLGIQPGSTQGHSGTMTIVENANGRSRVTFNARDNRGIQVEGEFTCVPRTGQ